jgi:hypothetical protein
VPLQKGSSQKTISANISELHKGKTYTATVAKFGKAKANAQAIAIAEAEARTNANKRYKQN